MENTAGQKHLSKQLNLMECEQVIPSKLTCAPVS